LRVRDYYDAHPKEFAVDELIRWNDLFISEAKFKTRAEAKQYAQTLLAHVQTGKDFVELGKKYDHGDSKFRDGFGAGEKRGDIRPADLEESLFRMNAGESNIIEMENGFHVVKMVQHTKAGLIPFNEKTQTEIRRKVTALVYEREYQRIADGLWRAAQPQIYLEP
jgi:parvulin-like peptidyl-prolyl isomerase